MRCGKELTAPPPVPPGPPLSPPPAPQLPPTPAKTPAPAAPPPVPPTAPTPTAPTYAAAPPPAPTYAAPTYAAPPYVPAGPSPAGQFVRRVVSGSWAWPAVAAAAPALFLLVTAGLLGATSAGEIDDPSIGSWVRFRGALALLLQGVGARLSATSTVQDYGDGAYSSAFPSDGDGTLTTSITDSATHTATATLSVVPLTVTLLWIAALVLVLRAVRVRQSGPEAAVRVALLSAAATLVLALVARPSVRDVHIGTQPAVAALVAFVLALATALVVLPGPGRAASLAARPSLVTALRVLRTALLALLLTVVFAGVIVFVVAADHYDDVTGWGLVAAVFLLPNLGASGLSLGWGGPFEAHATNVDGESALRTIGLSDLNTVFGGWATVGALLAALACALLIGLLAAWRSRDRAEQFAVAGTFTVLFLVLIAVSGASVYEPGDRYNLSVGSSLAEALLFGMLWSFGGVLVGPYVWRSMGGGPVPRVFAVGVTPRWAPPAPPAVQPFAAAQPPTSTQPFAAEPPTAEPSATEPPTSPPPTGTVVHDLGLIQHEKPEKPAG